MLRGKEWEGRKEEEEKRAAGGKERKLSRREGKRLEEGGRRGL